MGLSKLHNRHPFSGLFFLVSCAALLSQVIFMRQVLLLFEQSEYVISIFLFFWLAGNGLGVFLARKRSVTGPGLLRMVQVYAILILLAYYALHAIRPLLLSVKTPAHLYLGIAITVASVFIPSFYNGRLFSGFSNSLKYGFSVIGLYKVETAAFFLAGIASTIVVYFFSDFYLLLVALAVMHILVLVRKMSVLSSLLSVLLIGLLMLQGFVQSDSWARLFPGYAFTYKKQMPSGQMDVLVHPKNKDTIRLFQGRPVNAAKPPAAAEEAFYPAYSQTGNTAPRILLAGDAILPVLEALAFNPTGSVDILINDPKYFQEIRKGFPADIRRFLEEEHTEVIHAELQKYVMRDSSKYDIILISPQYPALMENALMYFPQNMERLKNAMGSDAVLCLLFSGEAAYAGRLSRALKGSVYKSLEHCFPETCLLALDNYTIILVSARPLYCGFEDMMAQLESKAVYPMYFNAFHVGFRMQNAEQIGVEQIREYPYSLSFNRPVTYLAGLLHMTEQYSVSTSQHVMGFAEAIYTHAWLWQIALVLILGLLFLWYLNKKPRNSIVFHAGFTGIAAQMMYIYLYQLHFGSIYLMIGILVALFMIGLTAGLSLPSRYHLAYMPFLVLFCIIGFLTLLFIWPLQIPAFLGMICSGLYTGICFAMNNAQLKNTHSESALGLYVNDLAGGLFGNLLIPLLFIPFLGFYMPVALFLLTGIFVWWYLFKTK